jgi:cytochrome c-type biogenesis protein
MIEWSLTTHIILPVSLGLLGFVEPCAIGSHMVILGALAEQSKAKRAALLFLFVATRTVALGAVGIVVAYIGQQYIPGQKAFWLLFGFAYTTLGALYIAGKAGVLMRRIGVGGQLASSRRGAVALGALFGLSVPACAAPLLFAVTASAAGVNAYALGFVTMALFGLALSAPLLLVAAVPKVGAALQGMRTAPRWARRTVGLLLVGAGLWSIWFGLFVEPRDWRMGQ